MTDPTSAHSTSPSTEERWARQRAARRLVHHSTSLASPKDLTDLRNADGNTRQDYAGRFAFELLQNGSDAHEKALRMGLAGFTRGRRGKMAFVLTANSFCLVTSLPQDEVPAAELLALYRRRGRAEYYMGEWKSGLHPLLSSNNRTKRHYRGQEPAKRAEPVDAFANNEVTLLLSMLAYQLTHALRTLQEEATGRTHSLVQFRERVMKVAARVLLSARRITVVVPGPASR
jgi:hypothetical protein